MHDDIPSGSRTFAAGPAIRAEYLNLPRDLLELADGFNLDLPLDCQRDTTILVYAIECVDRILDSLPDAECRAQFSAAVLAALEGDAANCDNILTAEAREHLSQLHEVIQRRNIHAPFCQITARILHNTEQMRTTRNSAFYVHAAVAEGRWMVELLLLVLGAAASPRLREFMRQVAGPANLGDKLRDARCDFALGELALKPGLMLHLRLGCGMLWRVLALAVRFCAYRRVLAWGLKSLRHELPLRRQPAV